MSVIDPRQGASGEVFYTLKVQKKGATAAACSGDYVMSARDPHFPIQHRCIARPMHFNCTIITGSLIPEKYRFLSIKTKNTPMQYGHQINSEGQRVSYQTLGIAKATDFAAETSTGSGKYRYVWELAQGPNEFATIFPSPFSHSIGINLCDEKGGNLSDSFAGVFSDTEIDGTAGSIETHSVLWTLVLSFQPLQETSNQPKTMPHNLAPHEAGPFRGTPLAPAPYMDTSR